MCFCIYIVNCKVLICCVTGHRPEGFPFPREQDCFAYMEYQRILSREIEILLRGGYRDFISGMARGADMDFAHEVIKFRDEEGFISLEAALAYPCYPSKRKTNDAAKRDDLIAQCNLRTEISSHYHRGCMQKRNRYMVDKADIVFAIWNGKKAGGTWDTIQYARQKKKDIRYLMLTGIPCEPFMETVKIIYDEKQTKALMA